MANDYRKKGKMLAVKFNCPSTMSEGDPVRIASDLTVAGITSSAHRDIIGSVIQHADDNTYCTVETSFNRRMEREAHAQLPVGPFVWGVGSKPTAWTPGGFATVTGTEDGPFAFAKASFTGTEAETFEITLDTNDAFKIKVGSADPLTLVLTPGAARTAAQVVSDINALAGVVASATAEGNIKVEAEMAGTKIELMTVANDCYTELGLTVGVYEAADSISITVGSGAAQALTFTAGETAIADVVTAINENVTGITATASGNKLVLTCDELGVDFTIDEIDNDAYTLLGLASGAVSNTDPSHSELAVGGVVICGPEPRSLEGTVKGPYAITNGSNDAMVIAIGSGSDQTFDLTAGESRTATQVATDINATATGFVASVSDDRVVLTATAPWNDIIIKTVANNAYNTLGFTVGSYAASKTVQTLEY
jgi:hypothetical protein